MAAFRAVMVLWFTLARVDVPIVLTPTPVAMAAPPAPSVAALNFVVTQL